MVTSLNTAEVLLQLLAWKNENTWRGIMSSPDNSKHPRVFISYSHKDEDWKNRLIPHLRTLEQQGEIALWDDRKINPGEDWYPAIKKELEQAAVAICLISADYLASDFINKEEIPELKLRRGRDGMLLLPILVSPCPWKTVQWLRGIQMFPRDGKSLAEIHRKVDQERALAHIAEYVYEKINEPSFQLAAPPTEWEPPEKVDIDRLPDTGMELFGRQKELGLLDKAWQSGVMKAVSLVAWGGVGKSTLVNKWLELMRVENYRGARRVFGWSFYSQGTKEQVTCADKFISEALAWFGDPDPTQGSPWDKGQRLADLVRKQKTLLILDGLEPLQSSADFERGKIKDPALSIMVTQLARENNGLCVITTREKVAELARFDKGVQQLNLDQISKEAGRALLRVGGVQGTDVELEAASEEFGNHALAVNLLASFIHDIPGHYISNAAQIEDLDIPEEEGRHPRRVIQAFEKRFGEGPEVQLLRILGLFDQPVEMDAVKAVYGGSPIKGLTDKLANLTDAQWQSLLEKLRGYKLLAKKSTHRPDIIDCHPLVREHFGEKLAKGNSKAWRKAHTRLYEYYKNLPKKKYPDTLEEMQPLFAAVAHGCQAGLHQKAHDDIYWDRIHRKEQAYSVRQLGAFGSDLSALAGFFDVLWTKPVPTLNEPAKAWVLNGAGFSLRALGRLWEAVPPMEKALDIRIKQKDWKNADINAGNLSELYLTLGETKKAMDFAEKSVEYADISKKWDERMTSRTALADALAQAGRLTDAEKLFLEAESMQKDYQPQFPYLYSLQGFQFCDLLLTKGQFSDVQKRAMQTLKWAEEYRLQLLTFALDKLSLGRAYMLQAEKEKTADFSKAIEFLNQAVNGLRNAGQQQYLPFGLLARAALYRLQGNFRSAWADLTEAKEIAERSEMKLYLADYHLEAARLHLAEGGKYPDARDHYEKAKTFIDQTGYHRRDAELAALKSHLDRQSP
jgi:tetratricopeptide (TPR) repeat protein